MSTIEDKPPFAFGQVVYVVEGSAHGQVDVPCPICFGQLYVTLILGNGEQQKVECEACGKGCSGPTGVVSAWKPWSKVVAATVTGLNHEGGKWRVSVSGIHSSSEHIFADEKTAEAFRESYHKELEDYARRMDEQNMMRHKKQHTWSASYHREHIRRLRQEMEYHEKKLLQKKEKKQEVTQ